MTGRADRALKLHVHVRCEGGRVDGVHEIRTTDSGGSIITLAVGSEDEDDLVPRGVPRRRWGPAAIGCVALTGALLTTGVGLWLWQGDLETVAPGPPASARIEPPARAPPPSAAHREPSLRSAAEPTATASATTAVPPVLPPAAAPPRAQRAWPIGRFGGRK